VLEAAFVLLEFSSPSRRIFIGSHSLLPLSGSPYRSFRRAGKRTVAGGGRTARRRGRRRPRAGLEAGGGGVGGARGEVGQFGEEDNRGLVGPTRDLLWPRWVGGSRVSAKERVLSR
jgi:hypothetical protein